MRLLSECERELLLPAEVAAFDSPVPTQIVSSDEFAPTAQTRAQREVEARLKTLADESSCAPQPVWPRRSSR